MKRDMDLVREILLKVEVTDEISSEELLPEGASPAEEAKLVDHLHMLAEEVRFLRGRKYETLSDIGWMELRLTWAGHEYLDTIRDPEVWAKTKEGAAKVGGFSVDVMKALAKGYLKKQIADRTGLEVDL